MSDGGHPREKVVNMLLDASIVGVGTSDQFGFSLGKSPLTLATEAFTAALADAGLDKSAVDGLITSLGSPAGVDYDEFAIAAGLDLRWASQHWAHGRWATTSLAEAAMAISAGLVSVCVLVNATTSARGYLRGRRRLGTGAAEGLRDVGGGHGEWEIHGIESPGVATALVARKYMDLYGATEEDLAAISIGLRRNASLNPMAIMGQVPMDLGSYMSQPLMAGPFRRPDYCLVSEGATCLILTSSDRARDCRGKPARVAGVEGLRTSRDDYVLFARSGLGAGIEARRELASLPPPVVYERAGRPRSDIDGLYMYDAFSSNVWMVLERFGFCLEGEAAAYVSSVGIGLDSPLPVNTNGGLLSEAHLSGYAHLVEMVRQLQGTCAERQIPRASALQWATPRGDSVILTRDAGGNGD